MWSAEEIELVHKNIIGIPYAKLAELLNAEFGTNKRGDCVKAFCAREGISNYVNKWSEEEKQFLRDHIDMPYRELAEAVSRVIGVTRSEVNTRNECYHLGLHNNRDTRFSNGHKALNDVPIGTERRQGRKTYVKVSTEHRGDKDHKHGQDRNYRLKNELLWEAANGQPVPKNHVVIFVDGDRNNFDISNLKLVSNSIKQTMNKKGWQFEDEPEMRKTAIMWCELREKLRETGVDTEDV